MSGTVRPPHGKVRQTSGLGAKKRFCNDEIDLIVDVDRSLSGHDVRLGIRREEGAGGPQPRGAREVDGTV